MKKKKPNNVGARAICTEQSQPVDCFENVTFHLPKLIKEWHVGLSEKSSRATTVVYIPPGATIQQCTESFSIGVPKVSKAPKKMDDLKEIAKRPFSSYFRILQERESKKGWIFAWEDGMQNQKVHGCSAFFFTSAAEGLIFFTYGSLEPFHQNSDVWFEALSQINIHP